MGTVHLPVVASSGLEGSPLVRRPSLEPSRANEDEQKTNVSSSTYKQRSEEFRRQFKDIPETERLIVDYACALQRDILLQGRLYLSETWLCFHSNIFRWETSDTSLRTNQFARFAELSREMEVEGVGEGNSLLDQEYNICPLHMATNQLNSGYLIADQCHKSAEQWLFDR
ncbi:hypothetical protein NDU88_000659 [Pleurodeles waltl]|uniref:GRAM domain-containing protein n=1 Tax=Pleurodeles waltl TaxID=8319 RepID=A0AAV7N8L2_PLEWA|nr:hypothetical protein NDU88_000659 [Pleurodeles waltl]